MFSTSRTHARACLDQSSSGGFPAPKRASVLRKNSGSLAPDLPMSRNQPDPGRVSTASSTRESSALSRRQLFKASLRTPPSQLCGTLARKCHTRFQRSWWPADIVTLKWTSSTQPFKSALIRITLCPIPEHFSHRSLRSSCHCSATALRSSSKSAASGYESLR